jgi:hypothetical protein
MRMRTRCCYLRFIASALRKDKHFPTQRLGSRSRCWCRVADRRTPVSIPAWIRMTWAVPPGGPVAGRLHGVAALALQVGLYFPERPRRTADNFRRPGLHQHPGVQRVHRPLALRQPAWGY